MTGFHAIAWPGWVRPDLQWVPLDRAAAAVGIALMLASVAGQWQQTTAGDPPSKAGARAAEAAEAARALSAAPTRELMVAGYGGAQFTYPSNVSLKNLPAQDFTAERVGWNGEPFKSPIYYGARIVRWLGTGRTGTMLDFTHSKVLARLEQTSAFSGILNGAPAPARAVLGDVFQRLEFTHGHNMLTLNGLWRLPSLAPRLSPYVGLGVGISLPHTEVQLKNGAPRTYEYQYTGPAAQALLGLEVRFARISYFIEYKFTFARYEAPITHRDGSILFVDLWHQLQRWLGGEKPPGGFVSTLLASHQLISGLGVRAAAAPVTSD